MSNEPDDPDEAKVEMLYPAIPEDLSSSAIKVWKQLVISLVKQGTLTENEKPLFKEYCECVGDALDYGEFLADNGESFIDDNGENQIRPEVELRHLCWKRSREIAPLLGIGYQARSLLDEPKIERKKRKQRGLTQGDA